jgi:microcystin degradation protein MlrC
LAVGTSERDPVDCGSARSRRARRRAVPPRSAVSPRCSTVAESASPAHRSAPESTAQPAGPAEREAVALARHYWDLRFQLEPRIWQPDEAIRDGLRYRGAPVLLLETSDCIGGGATGDSAAVLKALVREALPDTSLAYVEDPEAAAACHRAGEGARLRLAIGHTLDPQWGAPMHAEVAVEKLTDGRFVYSGGIWAGQTGDMGQTARVRIGTVQVLLASRGTYDWADEQYRSVGMDTGSARFIVVKNPMNYRVGYAGRHSAVYVLDTPGPTPASLRHVKFQSLARPFFPQDENIPGMEPTVLRGP